MAMSQKDLSPKNTNTQHSFQRMTSLQSGLTEQSLNHSQPPQKLYHSLPTMPLLEQATCQSNFALAHRKVCALGLTPTDTGFGNLVANVGAVQVGYENEPKVAQLIASQTLNAETLEKAHEYCKKWGVSLTTRESLINLTAMFLSEKEKNPQSCSFLDTTHPRDSSNP